MMREPTTCRRFTISCPLAFVGKDDLRQTRHGERIDEPEQHRRHEGHEQCDVMQVLSIECPLYARPSAVMITSISLIPMNGTMMPPRP